MPEPAANPDLWTDARCALRDWFERNAPRMAPLYQAAVRLLGEPGFPARTRLLAHAVRELANALPEVVTGKKVTRAADRMGAIAAAWRRDVPRRAIFGGDTPEVTSGPPALSPETVATIDAAVVEYERGAENRATQAAALFQALRPSTPEQRAQIEPVVREWVDGVAWFAGHAHEPRRDDVGAANDAELVRRFEFFEDGLRGITARYFEVVRDIVAELAVAIPGDASLEHLLPRLGGVEQQRCFFEELESWEWIPALKARGFFDRAPASQYLVRMATIPEAAAAVAMAAVDIETADRLVHKDLAKIAQALPVAHGRVLRPRLEAALQADPDDWLVREMVEVALRWAVEGACDEARPLVQALLGLLASAAAEPPPASRPPADPQAQRRAGAALDGLRAVPSDTWAALAQHLGIALLHDVRRALEAVLDQGHHTRVVGALKDDYSSIWRPAIEQESGHRQTKGLLVSLLFAVAQTLASREAPSLKKVISLLTSRPWLVARRVALYLLAVTPGAEPALVEAQVLERGLFERFESCREYRMLLRAWFGRLSGEAQTAWLAWIEQPPPAAALRASLERWSEEAVTDDAIARSQRRWQWQRLGPVEAALPADWQSRAQALQREFGVPPEPSAVERPQFAVGWPSPFTQAQVRAWSLDELIERLRAWQPSPEEPLVQAEGLAQILSDVVAAEPQRLAIEAKRFEGLPPTFVRAVLGGLGAAQRAGLAFDRPPVLALAAWVLNQPVIHPEPPWNGVDRGWGPARRAVLDLLDDALTKPGDGLSGASREAIWALLCALMQDPDPARAGDALEAGVRYALWTRARAGRAEYGGDTLDDVPELREALDVALGQEGPAALRLREAIGHQLPRLVALDPTWTRARLALVFPPAPEQQALWRSAWHAFLHADVGPHERVFPVMRDVYADAVHRLAHPWPAPADTASPTGEAAGASVVAEGSPSLAARRQDERKDERGDQRLAEHLVVLYGRGALDGSAGPSLLDEFFAIASADLRRHALWFVAYSLREHQEDVPADVVVRFSSLWRRRVAAAVEDPTRAHDLATFGLWAACPQFDAAWRLEQLELALRKAGHIDHAHQALAMLAEQAPSSTSAAARCLALLVEPLADAEGIYGWIEHVPPILAAGLRSDDLATREQALATYHQLGTLGLRPRMLLPPGTDLDDPATIPYFTWDAPLTVAEIRKRLQSDSDTERLSMLGKILREARVSEAWKFTTPVVVDREWDRLAPRLGRRRDSWRQLLDAWREQQRHAPR